MIIMTLNTRDRLSKWHFFLQCALEVFPLTIRVMDSHITLFFKVSHGLVQMTFFPQGKEIQPFEYTRKELLLFF